MEAGSVPPAEPGSSLTVKVGRNVAFHFAARAVEALFLIVAIPLIVRGLGPERYGVFSLGLIILLYVALVEFGVSQALVALLSERRARGDVRGMEGLLGSSIALYAGAALTAGVLMTALAPRATDAFLNVPPALRSEAIDVLRLVGLAAVALLLQAPPRAFLMSFHRSSVVNGGQLLGALLKYPATLLVLKLDGRLLPTFAAYSAGALVELAVAGAVAARLLRAHAPRPRWDGARARELLRFSAATSASTLSGALLFHLDKVAIGVYLPVAALGVYHVAYSLAGRISEIPRAVHGSVPAAFSELAGTGQRERLGRAYVRTFKLLFSAPLHLLTLLLLGGRGLLEAWVGPDLAREGAAPLKLLAAAYFLASVTHAPYMFASAAGFPGIPARTRLLLLLPCAALILLLTRGRGLEGAALACLVVALADLACMAAWVHRRGGLSVPAGALLKPLALSAAVGALTWTAIPYVAGLPAWLALFGLSYALYLAGTFAWILEPEERAFLKRRGA